jgi:hypothetical protein
MQLEPQISGSTAAGTFLSNSASEIDEEDNSIYISHHSRYRARSLLLHLKECNSAWGALYISAILVFDCHGCWKRYCASPRLMFGNKEIDKVIQEKAQQIHISIPSLAQRTVQWQFRRIRHRLHQLRHELRMPS